MVGKIAKLEKSNQNQRKYLPCKERLKCLDEAKVDLNLRLILF